MKTKTILIILSAIVLSFLLNDTTFAATLSYDMNQDISSSNLSNEGLIRTFSGYYKWIVLWTTVINVLVSIFIGLKMMSSIDKEELAKNKKSLMTVNLSYLSLMFLGFMIIFIISIFTSTLKDTSVRSQDNSLIMGGGLYTDVSPFNDDKTKLLTSINEIKNNSIILDSLGVDSVNVSPEKQAEANEQQIVYNKVMLLLSNDGDDEEVNYLMNLGIPSTNASNTVKNSVKNKVVQLKENNLIDDNEFDIFNRTMRAISNKANQ